MEFASLIQQPESRRDQAWEANFLDGIIQNKVQVESDQAKAGPDGWPYLFVRTGPEGQEPVRDVIGWLGRQGIGLVVNAHKMLPDYIFTYGMIWNFVETGRFVFPDAPAPQKDVVYSKDDGWITGAPSEKYLPPYVRQVLRDFLQAQGFLKPRVLVVSSKDFAQVDLVFSVESLNQVPQAQHATVAEMLGWFLPLHYNLVLAEEKSLPPFHAL